MRLRRVVLVVVVLVPFVVILAIGATASTATAGPSKGSRLSQEDPTTTTTTTTTEVELPEPPEEPPPAEYVPDLGSCGSFGANFGEVMTGDPAVLDQYPPEFIAWFFNRGGLPSGDCMVLAMGVANAAAQGHNAQMLYNQIAAEESLTRSAIVAAIEAQAPAAPAEEPSEHRSASLVADFVLAFGAGFLSTRFI